MGDVLNQASVYTALISIALCVTIEAGLCVIALIVRGLHYLWKGRASFVKIKKKPSKRRLLKKHLQTSYWFRFPLEEAHPIQVAFHRIGKCSIISRLHFFASIF
jgi:hypothetical protein